MNIKHIIIFTLAMTMLNCTGCGGSSGGGSYSPTSPIPPTESTDNFDIWYDVSLSGPLHTNVEDNWLEVQTCAGIPAPSVNYQVKLLYVPASEMPKETGAYTPYTRTIHIDERYIGLDLVLRHEMIHHLLDITGFPIEQNEIHEPEWLWSTCIYRK